MKKLINDPKMKLELDYINPDIPHIKSPEYRGITMKIPFQPHLTWQKGPARTAIYLTQDE